MKQSEEILTNSSSSINLPSVAVVILNWNGKGYLEKFLPSVCESTYQNLNIVVADNASTDDSITFLKNSFKSVQVIELPQNFGFAKGYNQALKNLDYDYFVLLNSDVLVTANWIEPIIALMETDKQISACQPKILSEQMPTHFEYAGASGGFIDYWGYPFARGRILETLEKDEGQYDNAMPCFWATGAAMFVRAKVFKSLKGFDDYFFAHQEEIDLCWRMQRSGYKVYVEPKSVVYHVGGGTLPVGNAKKVFLNFRNNLIMLWKNSSFFEATFKIIIRFGLDALAAYKALFSGDFKYFFAVAKSHFAFIYWLLFVKSEKFPKSEKGKIINGIYKGSIIWQYFFKGKKKFSEIV
jgi:GT2 family glycosyltransferase